MVAIVDELEAKSNDTEGSTLIEAADQKMAEDMDDIIKLCNEINEHDNAKGKIVAHQVVEKGMDDTDTRNPEKEGEYDDKEEDGPNSTKEERYDEKEEDNPNLMKEKESKREEKVVPAGAMEEDSGLIDELSQEEDEEDLSSQCKHCGVDMVIDTELKKHILLRFASYHCHQFLFSRFFFIKTIVDH